MRVCIGVFVILTKLTGSVAPFLFRDLRDNVILKHSRLTVCYDFKAEIYRKSLKFITNRVVFERCEC